MSYDPNAPPTGPRVAAAWTHVMHPAGRPDAPAGGDDGLVHLAGAALAALLLATTAALAGVAVYGLLTWRRTRWWPPVLVGLAVGVVAIALLGGPGPTPRRRRTGHGETVPPQGFYYWAFDGAAVSKTGQAAFAADDFTPLRPFTLHPGETRYVRLDFHTATCDPAGLQSGFSRIRSLPVRYRTLGVSRTTTVPLDEVTIAIGTIGKCDHPLPNRS